MIFSRKPPQPRTLPPLPEGTVSYTGPISRASLHPDGLALEWYGPGSEDNSPRLIPYGAIRSTTRDSDRYGVSMMIVHLRGHPDSVGGMNRNTVVLHPKRSIEPLRRELTRRTGAAAHVDDFELPAAKPRRQGVPRDTPVLDWLSGG